MSASASVTLECSPLAGTCEDSDDFLLLLQRRRPDLSDILIKPLHVVSADVLSQPALFAPALAAPGNLAPLKCSPTACSPQRRSPGLLSLKAHIEGAPWVRPDFSGQSPRSPLMPTSGLWKNASAAQCSDSEPLESLARSSTQVASGGDAEEGSELGASRASCSGFDPNDKDCAADRSSGAGRMSPILPKYATHSGCCADDEAVSPGSSSCPRLQRSSSPLLLPLLHRSSTSNPGCSTIDPNDPNGNGNGNANHGSDYYLGRQRLRPGSPSLRDLASLCNMGALSPPHYQAASCGITSRTLPGELSSSCPAATGGVAASDDAAGASGGTTPSVRRGSSTSLPAVGQPIGLSHISTQAALMALRRAHRTGPLAALLPLLPSDLQSQNLRLPDDCVEQLLLQQQLLQQTAPTGEASASGGGEGGGGGGAGGTTGGEGVSAGDRGSGGEGAGSMSPQPTRGDRGSRPSAGQAGAPRTHRTVRQARLHAFLPNCRAAHISHRLQRLRAQLHRFAITPEPSQLLLLCQGDDSDGEAGGADGSELFRTASSPARMLSRSAVLALASNGDYDGYGCGDDMMYGEGADAAAAAMLGLGQRRRRRSGSGLDSGSAGELLPHGLDPDACPAVGDRPVHLPRPSSSMSTNAGAVAAPQPDVDGGVVAAGSTANGCSGTAPSTDRSPMYVRTRRRSTCSVPGEEAAGASVGRQSMPLPVRQPQPPVLPYGGILRLAVSHGSGLPGLPIHGQLPGQGAGYNQSPQGRLNPNLSRQLAKNVAIAACNRSTAAAVAGTAAAATPSQVAAGGGSGSGARSSGSSISGGAPEGGVEAAGCASGRPQQLPSGSCGGSLVSPPRGSTGAGARGSMGQVRRATHGADGIAASGSGGNGALAISPHAQSAKRASTPGGPVNDTGGGDRDPSTRQPHPQAHPPVHPHPSVSDMLLQVSCDADTLAAASTRLSVHGNCRATASVTPPPLLPSLKHQRGLRAVHSPSSTRHRHSVTSIPHPQLQPQPLQNQCFMVRQEHPLRGTPGAAAHAGGGGSGSGGGGGTTDGSPSGGSAVGSHQTESAVAVVLAVADGSCGSQEQKQHRQYKVGYAAGVAGPTVAPIRCSTDGSTAASSGSTTASGSLSGSISSGSATSGSGGGAVSGGGVVVGGGGSGTSSNRSSGLLPVINSFSAGGCGAALQVGPGRAAKPASSGAIVAPFPAVSGTQARAEAHATAE